MMNGAALDRSLRAAILDGQHDSMSCDIIVDGCATAILNATIPRDRQSSRPARRTTPASG